MHRQVQEERQRIGPGFNRSSGMASIGPVIGNPIKPRLIASQSYSLSNMIDEEEDDEIGESEVEEEEDEYKGKGKGKAKGKAKGKGKGKAK